MAMAHSCGKCNFCAGETLRDASFSKPQGRSRSSIYRGSLFLRAKVNVSHFYVQISSNLQSYRMEYYIYCFLRVVKYQDAAFSLKFVVENATFSI